MKWESDSAKHVRNLFEQIHGVEKYSKWFAWYPIEIGNNVFWLCYVERCTKYSTYSFDTYYVFREIKNAR